MQVLKERDNLKEEVFRLEVRVEDLTAEKERLNAEHAEELLILSSSLSEHFGKTDESQDSSDSRHVLKGYEKEIKRLRETIEDKNYHINKLQQKILKAQYEMEEELEKHENEVENLRSELEKAREKDDKDTEDRLEGIKTKYEKEIEDLRAQLESSESASEGDRTSNGVHARDATQEIEELKLKLKILQDNNIRSVEVEERLEEEKMNSREEIMAVKDRLTHEHQAELNDLLSQLQQANSEVERLREALHKEKPGNTSQKENSTSYGYLAEGQGGRRNGKVVANYVENVEINGPVLGNGDLVKAEESLTYIVDKENGIAPEVLEEIKADLHGHYQQQIEQIVKKLQDEYQADLDENLGKMEEDWEQQFERQKTEYEQKMAAHQRQQRAQYQADISEVTSDMEDQIQALRDGHAQEIAELMGRLRESSEERRRSVLQQDTTQQQAIVIKEEYRSKVESLENELRVEKEKTLEYQQQMEAVEAQVQAFKMEKEEEVKMIEEELRKQCKLLVEKKGKELKERYQSELNEKLNKVEQHLRREYEEDMTKTKCELEESNRTLKEKYEREVSDIMVQMEDVQQRNKEVLLQEQKQFEEKQKEQFQKQLSEVMEKLEPYKAKCSALESENNQLTQKYKKDLSELKNKLDEVEVRYKGNEAMDGKHLTMLQEELDLYKDKIRQLEEGNKSLMGNYEAQLANLKKNYEETDDAEFKTLHEEVKIYTNKVQILEGEKRTLIEKYEAEVSGLKAKVGGLEREIESQTTESERKNRVNEELAGKIEELSNSLESYKNTYDALVEAKKNSDNKHTEELEGLRAKTKELEKHLQSSREGYSELEEQRKRAEENHTSELERLKTKLQEESSVTQSKEEELQKFLKDKEGMEKELARIAEELDISKRKCTELETERQSMDNKHTEELAGLQEKIQELHNQVSENRDGVLKNAELVQRITQLERELKESQEYVAELEEIKRASDNKHAEEMAHSGDPGTSDTDMDNLKRDLQSSKETISELERSNAGYVQEIATLVADVENLKSSQAKQELDSDDGDKRYEEEIEVLRDLVEEQRLTIEELENEGENKFGILLSQHEKELETLKEELEEQIAKKREQLAKEAALKRQKLKEEYEGKLRVIYDELVSEKHRTRDQYKINEMLQKQIKSLEENIKRQVTEIERVKNLEETLKQFEEEMLSRNSEAETQKIVEEYEAKVRSLEAEVKALQDLSKNGEEDNKEEDRIKTLIERIASLEKELKTEKAEVRRLEEKLGKISEKDGHDTRALSESYESRLKIADEEIKRMSSKIEENQKEYERNLLSMKEAKDELNKTFQKTQKEKEKLEKTVSHLDAAKQAVVEMYDEKIELLAQELEDANERSSVSEEKLHKTKQSLKAKEAEWSNGLAQLRLEKDELVEENRNACLTLEGELTKEKESNCVLQQKVTELERQISERVGAEESLEDARVENKNVIEEYEAKAKVLETELQNEKEEKAKLKKTVEAQQEELSQSETKLKEINELMSDKEHVITDYEVKVKEIAEQLESEKGKTSKLEKELQGVLDNQGSEYVQNLGRIKSDLKEEYEETTRQLKKNYENLFNKTEEEHRANREEMEAEMVTLKGMVDNLEQLNQLKDEEYEVLIREQAKNHEIQVQELRDKYTEENDELLVGKTSAEKKVVEIVSEKEELVAEHVVEMKDLESRLFQEHQNEVGRLTRQVEGFDQERDELRSSYDREIELLNEQLVFETTLQKNLQSEHEKELLDQKETLENEHKEEVEKIQSALQEKIQHLESANVQRENEVKDLTVKLDEHNKEFAILEENLRSKHEAEMKILEERLHERVLDYEKLEALLEEGAHQRESGEHEEKLREQFQENEEKLREQFQENEEKLREQFQEIEEKLREQFQEKVRECENLKDQLKKLTTSVEELIDEKSNDEKVNSERMKTEYDATLASLRIENHDLNDRVQNLKSELEDMNVSHQQEIDFIKAEVERQFSHREDRITQRHSEELGILMEKLESLVQQESASKTLTEEHMVDLGTLRMEFEEKLERLLKEKEQELARARTFVENQYKAEMKEWQDQLKLKSRETQRLQESMGSLQDQVREVEIKNQEHQKALHEASEELILLRQENANLFRRLTEGKSRPRATSDAKLLSENERLKREIQNLKKLLENRSAHTHSSSDTSSGSEGTRLIQLIKLMEQLMKEKNMLELKLRQEIIDLKTRFIGDASKASLESGSLSLGSPVKDFNKDSLVETLQELRDNRDKQEEDIKEHVQEIENMMEEIKKRMDSAEFTDGRIQDMLASQLKHLQEQRRLMIQRLWQLREKHKSVEEKITRQIAELSIQSSPNSSANSVRSKLYESIFEENLRREKELLAMKRKQADDLHGRLEAEKLALERHTAQTKKLQRQLKEKDRLESELSSERMELEKKYMGKLKERGHQLTEGNFSLVSSDQGVVDHMLWTSRAPVSTSERKRSEALEENSRPTASLTSKSHDNEPSWNGMHRSQFSYGPESYEPLQQAVERIRQRRNAEKEHLSERTQGGIENPPSARSTTSSKSSSSSRPSQTTGGRKMEQEKDSTSIPTLDLSSDESDIELDLSNLKETLYWEMDFDDDSDIELYTPESIEEFGDLEKDWETTLEQELQQISAGLVVVPSHVRPAEEPVISPREQGRQEKGPGITGSDRDFARRTRPWTVGSTQSSVNSSSERFLQKESFGRAHQKERHPRTSTAVPGEDEQIYFGAIDLSQISSLPKDVASRKALRAQMVDSEKRKSQKGSKPKQPELRKSNASRGRTTNGTASEESPRSTRSEPVKRSSLYHEYKQRYMGTSAVYLLNTDDFVDRHLVQSSEDVARIRDLSPSEKRFMSKQGS